MSIKSKCLTKPLSLHDLMGHSIDERMRTFVMPTQPTTGIVFDVQVSTGHSYTEVLIQRIKQAHDYFVPDPLAQEVRSFSDPEGTVAAGGLTLRTKFSLLQLMRVVGELDLWNRRLLGYLLFISSPLASVQFGARLPFTPDLSG